MDAIGEKYDLRAMAPAGTPTGVLLRHDSIPARSHPLLNPSPLLPCTWGPVFFCHLAGSHFFRPETLR